MAKMTNALSIAALLAVATMTSGCIPSCCKKEAPKKEVVQEEDEKPKRGRKKKS